MAQAGGEQVVRFDRHQLLLLDRLVEDREFPGDTREEVALQAFRAYVESRRGAEASSNE